MIHVEPGHCLLELPPGLVSLAAAYPTPSLEFYMLLQDSFRLMQLV